MLLTDAFFLCGSHLVHGQVDPETVESEWSVTGRIEDLAAALEKGLADKDIAAALESFRPQYAVYQGLKEVYADLRAVAEKGGWPELPRARSSRKASATKGSKPSGGLLKRGGTSPGPKAATAPRSTKASKPR